MCNSNVEDKHSSTISTLLRTIKKHPNGKDISLKDYNLYHLMWKGPDIPYTDQTAMDLMHFMQKRNMDQFLLRGITIYKNANIKALLTWFL